MKYKKEIIFSILTILCFIFSFNQVSAAGCCVIGSSSKNTCYTNLSDTDCFGECDARSSSSVCALVTTDTTCGGQSSCNTPNAEPRKFISSSSGSSTSDLASSSSSTVAAAASATVVFDNNLQFDTVEVLLGNILKSLRGIVVVLSIIFIVIGGIMYIISSGDDKRVGTAKGMITASLLGLAIAIAAPSFLKEISTILGWDGSSSETASALSVSQIALNTLNFLLSIIGALAIIMMVVGGVMYLTSVGDQDRIENAKKIIIYSIIGIAVALASLVIVKQIANLIV